MTLPFGTNGKADEGFHSQLAEDGRGVFPAAAGFVFDERFAGVRDAAGKCDVHRHFKRLGQAIEIDAVHAAINHDCAIEIAKFDGDHGEAGHLAGFAGDGVEESLLFFIGEHDLGDALERSELAIAP